VINNCQQILIKSAPQDDELSEVSEFELTKSLGHEEPRTTTDSHILEYNLDHANDKNFNFN